MYYDYQRWYDPSTGRFISQDPLAGSLSDPQSQNPYIYARNLPTVLSDPSGADFGSDCHDSLCATPIPYYTGDLPPDVDPYVRDLCLQNRFWCPTILRYYGYGDDLEGDGITGADPAAGRSPGGSPGSAEPGPTTVTGSEGNMPKIELDTSPAATGVGTDAGVTAPNAIGSESGNIYDIGPGSKIPLHAEPSSVIRAYDVNGDLHNIGLYDAQGNLVERVDVLGRPHYVGLPHVIEYSNWTPDPLVRGGFRFGQSDSRPTNPAENIIIEFLSWL